MQAAGGTVRAAAGTVRTAEGTVRGGTVHGSNITYGGGGTVAGEEAALIRQMENHLSTLNPGDGSEEEEDYNGETSLKLIPIFISLRTIDLFLLLQTLTGLIANRI